MFASTTRHDSPWPFHLLFEQPTQRRGAHLANMDPIQASFSLAEQVGAIQNLQVQVSTLNTKNAAPEAQAASLTTPALVHTQQLKAPLPDKFPGDYGQF